MSLLRLSISTTLRLHRLPLSCCKYAIATRSIATEPQENKEVANKDTESEVSDWVSVYKFPYIRSLAAGNKLKIYQVLGTAVAIPASFVFPDVLSPIPAVLVGVTGLMTLSLASFALKNTVGFIYTSKSRPDLVKFAYMDFWGLRVDRVLKVEDVVPFYYLPSTFLSRYITILRFNNKQESLKLFVHRYGGVSNPTEFLKIFGVDQ